MNEWWLQRNARERAILLGGGLVALLVLGYSLVWEPLQQRLTLARQTVYALQQDLQWIQQAAAQLQPQRTLPTPSTRSNEPLLTLLDQSAKRQSFSLALKRIEPQGERVRLQFEQVDFDSLIRWLAQLERDQAISTYSLNLERSGLTVNAQLVLERPL